MYKCIRLYVRRSRMVWLAIFIYILRTFGVFAESQKFRVSRTFFVIVLVHCYLISKPVLYYYTLNVKKNKIKIITTVSVQDQSDLDCPVSLFNSQTMYKSVTSQYVEKLPLVWLLLLLAFVLFFRLCENSTI